MDTYNICTEVLREQSFLSSLFDHFFAAKTDGSHPLVLGKLFCCYFCMKIIIVSRTSHGFTLNDVLSAVAEK